MKKGKMCLFEHANLSYCMIVLNQILPAVAAGLTLSEKLNKYMSFENTKQKAVEVCMNSLISAMVWRRTIKVGIRQLQALRCRLINF